MVITLKLERVSYGKKDVESKLREYKLKDSDAVGTIAEWIEWSKKNDNPVLKFKDIDCSFVIGDK